LQIADNLPLHALDCDTMDRLRDQAVQCGILLEAGTRGLREDVLLRYLDIAKRLGAGLVRTLPHDGDDRPNLEEAIRRVRCVIPFYKEAGVTLGIENHDHYPAAWIRSLVVESGSAAIGVCVDTVNNLGQGEGEREVMEVLASHAVNFHCKDYSISRKDSMLGFDVVGTPAGKGMLNLSRAASLLPDGISWIIESWLPWQGDIASTVSLEEQWAAQGVRNLKRFRDG
jgi:sugar phosphate isomerase/epimerase